MFLSAQALAVEYGIDERIAKFFVDREPPEGNMYWKDKLLYLRPQPGYIFIPLIVDLYLRSGISLQVLLSEKFVGTVEQILHYAALEETGSLSHSELILQCQSYVQSLDTNKSVFAELAAHFSGAPTNINELVSPFKALQRGDVFLFSLSALNLDKQKFFELAETWFALISILLMMDDSEDYLSDLESGERNVFIESGSNMTGFEALKKLLTKNLNHIQAINHSMAHALHKRVVSIPEKPGIKEFLNA